MKTVTTLFVLLGIILSLPLHTQTHRFSRNSEDSLLYHRTLVEENKNNSSLADSNLTLVGEWPWGLCYAVAVRGNYAFVGNGKLVQVMDISNPSAPTIAAEFYANGIVQDIKLRDSLAFVCNVRGLQIWDISNLFSPVQISSISLSLAIAVVPTDSFAYVLRITPTPIVSEIDITDLRNPYIRAQTITFAYYPEQMAEKDRVIYVDGSDLPYLTIIDARDPSRLVRHVMDGIWSNAICVKDTFLYLGLGGCLATFSISNPIDPVLLDTIYAGVPSLISSITVDGNYAYTATEDSGIIVYDVSNPYQLKAVGRLETQRGYQMSYQNGLIHIATAAGYLIINTTKVDSMYQQFYFPTGGAPMGIVIRDHYAYVATGRPGLTILDLSNPTAPVRIGTCEFKVRTLTIFVSGNYAYLGTDSSVYIVDISDPRRPFEVSTIQTRAPSFDIFVEKNRLYNLVPSVGTFVYNISNPSMPIFLGSNTFAGWEIIVRDSIAYHAGGSGGFVIVDVEDPQNSIQISRLSYYTYALILRDSIAYLAASGGLYIINVSDPSKPESLSFIPAPVGGIDNSPSGKYIYMTSNKTTILDVSDPYLPKPVGENSYIGGDAMAVLDCYLYICQDLGISILKNDLITSTNEVDNVPKEFYLFQNYPNPFNPKTFIKFAVNSTQYVTLKLYNVLGEEVAVLVNEHKTPGSYVVKWDAENSPSGVYFYKLQAGPSTSSGRSFTDVKKMLLIR